MNTYEIHKTENETFDLVFNGQFIYCYTRKSSALRRVKQLLAAVKQPENKQNEAVALEVTNVTNCPKANAKDKSNEVHTTVVSKIKATANPIYFIFNIPSQEKGKSAEACAAKRVYAVRRARPRAAAPPCLIGGEQKNQMARERRNE